SLRKSSSSRNGSNSLVLPKPNARSSRTPAPSSVGFVLIISFTARNDILPSLSQLPCQPERSCPRQASSAARRTCPVFRFCRHPERPARRLPGICIVIPQRSTRVECEGICFFLVPSPQQLVPTPAALSFRSVRRKSNAEESAFPSPESPATSPLRLLHKLRINRDRHIVTHQHAAGLERRVPRQPKLLPADFRRRLDRHTRITPWVFARRRRSLHFERNCLRHALDRQLALNGAVRRNNLKALERHRRKLLHVEEVRSL